jgi:hypothetical protein
MQFLFQTHLIRLQLQFSGLFGLHYCTVKQRTNDGGVDKNCLDQVYGKRAFRFRS